MGSSAVTRERVVALRLLGEQRRRGARARELLRSDDELTALPGRQRGFVTRLVLGVVRTSGTLDGVIDAHLRGTGHLEPKVRDALRLSSYELLYLGTPARVAVSQGVELARRANRRTAGLANAVLHRVAEEDVPRMRLARARVGAGGAETSDLALVGGLPVWLVSRLGVSLSAADLRGLVLSLEVPPPVYVVANTAKGGSSEAERLMREAGLGGRPTGLPLSYELDGGGALARSGLVASGDLVPSDLAAQAVALACEPAPASRVLEVGQGRGTKSILLESAAIAAGGPCEICGVDSESHKVGEARRRMAAAGLAPHVRSWVLDGRTIGSQALPEGLRGTFDLVLVDAPCSGTGTMRRHPEIPWSLDEASVRQGGVLPELQLSLLAAASTRVRPGGRLVYATCSVLAEEDEDVVGRFLASVGGVRFTVTPFDQAPVGFVTREGYLRTLSFEPSADGHFCALLRRQD